MTNENSILEIHWVINQIYFLPQYKVKIQQLEYSLKPAAFIYLIYFKYLLLLIRGEI
jgi:hypothetical protein